MSRRQVRFEGAFLQALESAGLLGGVSLYGLVPAALVWQARIRRRVSGGSMMPGALAGEDIALIAIGGISTCLVVPELARIIAAFLSLPG